jgi:hypothetical protein
MDYKTMLEIVDRRFAIAANRLGIRILDRAIHHLWVSHTAALCVYHDLNYAADLTDARTILREMRNRLLMEEL